MMSSDDYKKRFKAEYYQLKIRIDKLSQLIYKFHKNKLEFKPACPISLLEEQYELMSRYLDTLRVRAEIEGIKL